ncbi:serine hydrolase [Actinomadura sp. ATCC 31491]|uniref:Serine hydrolase n=1 Tax=Actinomadura luzonensis TaxID=2805427 RepID=A0ABT0FT30_9ACTN|nr:serine hydrolase [Actinomadura luzonensis]MCK2215429.1 serine hydrolase [Actinomadura luzonensis]
MTLPSKTARTLAAALLATGLAACAAGTPAGAAVTPAATPTQSTPTGAPDTPAGRQLGWLLDAAARLPVPDAELARHFAAGFLQQIPPARVNQALAAYAGMRLDRLASSQDRSVQALVVAGGKAATLALTVDGAGLIDYLLFGAPAPTSWAELERRLRAAAPQAGFLAAELTGGGRCRPVHALAPATTRPLGSMFKLYVLGAVAERIRQGAFGWDTPITIRPELKSLPAGRLQDRPDGSTVTVLEAARLMISISDNTAADLLIHQAGRAAVERTVRAWGGDAARDVPFLTTRELFVLKGADYPHHARRYLSLGTAERRRYLARVVDRVPLSAVTPWNEPRELDRLEWFATPAGLCRAYAGLAELRDPRIGEIMSVNDAGLGLDPARWPRVWFKGGSEPGVLGLSFLARTAEGRTYVVALMGVSPEAPFDERTTGLELVALARGAFTLAAG